MDIHRACDACLGDRKEGEGMKDWDWKVISITLMWVVAFLLAMILPKYLLLPKNLLMSIVVSFFIPCNLYLVFEKYLNKPKSKHKKHRDIAVLVLIFLCVVVTNIWPSINDSF